MRPGITRRVEGREVSLTSLDRVLWPATGFTKGDMVDYYERVAPALLPHIAGRALTLGRFPDGVDGPGFAQTECRGRPDWVATAPIRLRTGELRHYCVVDDLPSLLWVANLGSIELHPFLARASSPSEPAAAMFDLDPEEPAGMADCARVALRLRDVLADRGLTAVPKTSGSAGIHVVVPLNSPHTYERTRAFARSVAERLAADDSSVVAGASRRRDRAGTVLVDWAQNSERRSTVAPYSLRATDRPSVSAPLAWEELEEGPPPSFGPEAVLRRLERDGDRFEPALTTVQRLGGEPSAEPGGG
ncbi:MAG: non-homologous end-joining DNA ligase [Actinomycetota bacterium]|nr:non-homologous end-joining DNA ligase [Actinomycetota bacterium]